MKTTNEPLDCPNCDNSGAIVVEVTGVGHGCCGDLNRDGSCCGNSIPVPVADFELEQCQWCYETPNSKFNSQGDSNENHL